MANSKSNNQHEKGISKMTNTKTVAQIIEMCGKAKMLGNGWCHFVYRHRHFVSIPDLSKEMLRISMPHVAKSSEYDKNLLEEVINETNRDVKFIKVIILKNGSISLNYDHKISDGDEFGVIIPHMVKTLCLASEYLITKLQSS